MTRSVIPFPVPQIASDPEEDRLLASAQENMLADMARKPVPDRLFALAAELGQALDRRRAELSAEEPLS